MVDLLKHWASRMLRGTSRMELLELMSTASINTTCNSSLVASFVRNSQSVAAFVQSQALPLEQ